MDTIIIISIISFLCIAFLIAKRFWKNPGIVIIDAKAAKKMAADGSALILDVRTAGEFAAGHLIGARLIPIGDLQSRIEELASFKNRQLLIYCRAGNRSNIAGRILKNHGYSKVANLKGGILAWHALGYPTMKGTVTPQ
jgi:rhodanese-related sulfurtransferase